MIRRRKEKRATMTAAGDPDGSHEWVLSLPPGSSSGPVTPERQTPASLRSTASRSDIGASGW